MPMVYWLFIVTKFTLVSNMEILHPFLSKSIWNFVIFKKRNWILFL